MRSGSDATTITLRTAALALAGGPPGGSAQRRLRAAVRDQARRAGVRDADADDVMAEVALALLGSPAPDTPAPLGIVLARTAVIARNKAIDHQRRRLRALPRVEADLPEVAAPLPIGHVLEGLAPTEAEAHRRSVSVAIREEVDRLPARDRLVVVAHATGLGPGDVGLPRSTFYRVLARAHERLGGSLRDRLAGLAAVPLALVHWGRRGASLATVCASVGTVALLAPIPGEDPAAPRRERVPVTAVAPLRLVPPPAPVSSVPAAPRPAAHAPKKVKPKPKLQRAAVAKPPARPARSSPRVAAAPPPAAAPAATASAAPAPPPPAPAANSGCDYDPTAYHCG